MPKYRVIDGQVLPDRDGVRVVTDTKTRTERIEPNIERDTQPRRKRREAVKDSGLAMIITGITVAGVGIIAALLGLLAWVPFVIALVTITIIAAAWPLVGEYAGRDEERQRAQTLDHITHRRRFTEEALGLDQAQHKRDLHNIARAMEIAEAERRFSLRAGNNQANEDMDLAHFRTAIERGESIGRRHWTGRRLPSGAFMTASQWQDLTKRLEAEGVIVQAGAGKGYRLTLTGTPAPKPAEQEEAQDDGRIYHDHDNTGPICSLDL